MRQASHRPAITLFQLLVVLAILLILLGLLLPAVAKTRQAAGRVQSMNNLKQLGLALYNYEAAYSQFPPGVDRNNFSTSAKILPFIEQNAVFAKIDFKKSIDDKDNAAMRAVHIKVFLSPQDP